MRELDICFVVDGGQQLGMGHVQQASTFASELSTTANVYFLTRSDEMVRAKIRQNGFDVTWCETDADILLYLQAKNPDIIIFDKLDVSVELARDIRQTLRSRLVIFTNLSGANQYADIAVTADIRFENIRFENIRFVDEATETLYFYGPKYWVLRREFYEYQRRGKDVVAKPERLLLMFGGSDPANLTSAALEHLLALDRRYELDVVLGAHFHHEEDFQSVLQRKIQTRSNVNVFRNISNVAELMYRADLVVASPGLSAFEALRVGTPIIVVPHDALQRDEYQNDMTLLERVDLWKLGSMIENGDFTYPNDTHIKRMQIGEGVQELKGLILGLTKRSIL